MRTTLTIDNDNAVRLERLRRERETSLKDVVNDAIRRGLNEMDASRGRREPFRTNVMDLGEPLFNSPEDLKSMLLRIDEEDDLKKLGIK